MERLRIEMSTVLHPGNSSFFAQVPIEYHLNWHVLSRFSHLMRSAPIPSGIDSDFWLSKKVKPND